MWWGGAGDKPSERRTATPDELRAACALYLEKHGFQPGDLVTWKPSMKNRRFPDYGEPVIVIEVQEGRYSCGEVGGMHEGEPTEIRVALIQHDGVFAAYWYDANRMMPYTEPTKE